MYPINLNVKNKLCVIVGGGRAACIKAKKLTVAGASVMVISPSLSEELALLPIHYFCAEYNAELLPEEAFIVICATDNPRLNQRIAKDAKKNKSLVLDAGNPLESDFSVLPHREGENWAVAVSTKGGAPGFSARLCDLAAQMLSPYEKVIAYLEKLRRRSHGEEDFRRLMELFASKRGQDILKTGDAQAYYQFIKSIGEAYMGEDVEYDA